MNLFFYTKKITWRWGVWWLMTSTENLGAGRLLAKAAADRPHNQEMKQDGAWKVPPQRATWLHRSSGNGSC